MMRLKIISKSGLDQPHHVVLYGDNGEPLMHSENYADIRDAEHLVELLYPLTLVTKPSEFTKMPRIEPESE